MFRKPKRRKLDQFLYQHRKDPEAALLAMTRLSNLLWRLFLACALTAVCIALLFPTGDWKMLLGLGFLVVLVNALGWGALVRIQPSLFDRPASFHRFVGLVLLAILLSKAVFYLQWSPFLAPLSLLAMVLGMLYPHSIALLMVIGAAFYLALLSPRMWNIDIATLSASLDGIKLADSGSGGSLTLLLQHAISRLDVILGLSLALGGLVSVLGVQHIRQQSRPAFVGTMAGMAQAMVVLAFQTLDPGFTYRGLNTWERVQEFLRDPAWALAGGLVSGGLITIFLPWIESLFSIVTERRLLALSDPNNELLKTLRNRAPGTYQHTLGVAQLASAAGEAIGADALLCQVGAYYHDIGKIIKPEYFVENMGEDKSIHSRLRPSMSKLIIIAHVKEGIELAQEAKLPQKIIDMIPMHHGTTVVEYFYQKARELANGEARDHEVEYRYPGPKPRFREAGILMLADAVEATAKTVSDPNPNRFRGMVSEIIRRRLHDDQLDECNLTIRDLRQIEDSFVRTLTTVHHARIRYPSNEGSADGEAADEGRPAAASDSGVLKTGSLRLGAGLQGAERG
jgi:putative nucleotidyltransferase with HDIG domain